MEARANGTPRVPETPSSSVSSQAVKRGFTYGKYRTWAKMGASRNDSRRDLIPGHPDYVEPGSLGAERVPNRGFGARRGSDYPTKEHPCSSRRGFALRSRLVGIAASLRWVDGGSI
jgi:hypothetical protein